MSLHLKPTFRERLRAVLRPPRPISPRPSGSPIAAEIPGAESAWDEAFNRVESYLRAHHVESRVLLNQLTSEIIQSTRELALEQPTVPPVTLAMQVTHARIGDWFVRVLHEGDWADERFRARGRLALLMANVTRDCPDRFLADEPLPVDSALRLRTARLIPGPELRLTSMPAAPLDHPAADESDERWITLSRPMLVRASATWLFLAGGLSLLWFTTR